MLNFLKEIFFSSYRKESKQNQEQPFICVFHTTWPWVNFSAELHLNFYFVHIKADKQRSESLLVEITTTMTVTKTLNVSFSLDHRRTRFTTCWPEKWEVFRKEIGLNVMWSRCDPAAYGKSRRVCVQSCIYLKTTSHPTHSCSRHSVDFSDQKPRD